MAGIINTMVPTKKERNNMNIEIFYSDVKDQTDETCFFQDGEPLGSGWYYWTCFPGCLPEGDPMGPFDTEDEAKKDAIENNYVE